MFLLRLHPLVVERHVVQRLVDLLHRLQVLVVYFCHQRLVPDYQLLRVPLALFHLVVPIFLDVLQQAVDGRQLLFLQRGHPDFDGLFVRPLFLLQLFDLQLLDLLSDAVCLFVFLQFGQISSLN